MKRDATLRPGLAPYDDAIRKQTQYFTGLEDNGDSYAHGDRQSPRGLAQRRADPDHDDSQRIYDG